ncbi:MAG TPA: aconitase/3-isopropylmalate dehydratase large subunit family protein [Bacteroidales bacterium]|nr:aconitase/3-isopropylmalate dehydratase large subunit family protein [Bacteroidales bacterium]HOO65890.1 aconitase/3-isopropylmalate dehydratase large subunit family protein [Bacteroidales bacterium]HPE23798.1 aconitase/3-isopropylmalate dehydratase large subunit family protein [Bacteroidales bacterium]HPJ04665.1 aconitase/3-isopropylmalate dehydratase large subunit family protein [Bacteroidales bacterium]HPQ63375.1 aconitase/3-isopropylmalate dehydratase large subunit family protein [Bacter
MGMTITEKIIAAHSKYETVRPGDIVDITIDARAARDFGGANVVKNLNDFGLKVEDPEKTLFTFDCNPTGSDQKYAVNQHICRQYARSNGIRVYDINAGIGTHLLIEEGYVWPGATAISTDSHANILGAVGAFGQGMGDMDIAAAWNSGRVWFKVPASVKLTLNGSLPEGVTAKDVILNLLRIYGANTLLGHSIELYGEATERMTLDERITIASMATEMGAIIILFPPTGEIIEYCRARARSPFEPVYADMDAQYALTADIDVATFVPMVSRPGEPHDTVGVKELPVTRIDSAFIGSCTNGRLEDMRITASILKGKKVAPGVVLKIVPSTDAVWMQCLEEGLLEIFKNAGALVSNAGCAGCAAGQVGQNGKGEVTISTGNRNFPGKQGQGSVFLASPAVVASSAVAGYITTPDAVPATPLVTDFRTGDSTTAAKEVKSDATEKPSVIRGRVWLIERDNIDTDMIFHNRYLAITDIREMGQYAFDNLEGYRDFASKAQAGDIIIAGKNFGSGSSRQQAVDCFVSLGVQAVIARSFGAIYERNAINAAFPVLTYESFNTIDLKDQDIISVNLVTGEAVNERNGLKTSINPFYDAQYEIYKRGGLLGKK